MNTLESKQNGCPETVIFLEQARNDALTQLVAQVAAQHPKRTIANPGPIGLIAFGMTTTLNMMTAAGAVSAATGNLVTAYALFHGGLLQFLAGMWEMGRGNTFGATAFSAYGIFWMANSLYSILAATYQWPANQDGLCLWFSLYGLFTLMMFVCTFRLTRSHQFVFATLALTFFLLARAQYSSNTLRAAGVVGTICGLAAIFTICGLAAIFTGWAELVNEMWGRVVLPLGVMDLTPNGLPRGLESSTEAESHNHPEPQSRVYEFSLR